jgi:glycine/D-amino acid oxidase-like deaminating enzyme
MARRAQTDFAILGLGVAGAATAYTLVQQCPGQRITALDRVDGRATSLTNQKWKHSGLWYPEGRFAWALWTAYQKMDAALERPYLLKQGA